MLTKKLIDAGFKEVDKDGKKVTDVNHSVGFHGLSSGRTKTKFVRGDKSVELEFHPNAGGTSKHITFLEGKEVLSFTNTGDDPSPDFLKTFLADKEPVK